MSRRAWAPPELRNGPFTVADANANGVSREQLRSLAYCRIGAGLYRWVGLKEGPHLRLSAVARRLPAGAAFSGRTAAWLHGLDVTLEEPVEVTIPRPTTVGRRVGALVRRAALADHEIVFRRGLPTTSSLRTVVDLGGRQPLSEGVVASDLFLHAELVTVEELRDYIAGHSGASGIARLRRAVSMADSRAESPMETRLRILLELAGLPRPEVNATIEDERGDFIARPDLLYRRQRLAIEFDGGNHRDRLVDDNRRQNRIVDAGFRLLRFSAADVYGTPDMVVTRVRDCLRRRLPPS